ncbi:MAG: hypothetical protein HKO90_01250 [Flavobacteriaceae bacterium]|nr:hypothetical protein [Bacteroidia bacterium]NNK86884.1 hypothetical protein [Flavobacteriaceae bacterium]
MHKIYFLKTCNTCSRIIKQLKLPESFIFQDIKENEITVNELDHMRELAGSYEALFSKRAKLYKEMGLKGLELSEEDIRDYILQHYTFLKRPVIIFGDSIFIGNSKAVIEQAHKALQGES